MRSRSEKGGRSFIAVLCRRLAEENPALGADEVRFLLRGKEEIFHTGIRRAHTSLLWFARRDLQFPRSQEFRASHAVTFIIARCHT